MGNEELDVSIIIPCFNEMDLIEQNVPVIKEIMDATKWTYEIILYDDFSSDGTRKVGKEIAEQYKEIKWLAHEKNCGRGKTVMDGIMASRGKIVGFIDMDLEAHAIYMIPMIIEIQKGADVVLGDRLEHLRPRKYSFLLLARKLTNWSIRFVLSEGYSFLVKRILGVKISDTEVGLKFFNKKRVMPYLKETKNHGWFWDTEIMTRVYYSDLKIVEYPVLFLRNYNKRSTVRIFSDSWNYFRNLIKLLREDLPDIKKKGNRH